jgi:hypothetical protein
MGDMADYYMRGGWFDLNPEDLTPRGLAPHNFKWWRMGNGKRILVTKMKESHLMNSINKIDRDQWRLEWKKPLMKELESR